MLGLARASQYAGWWGGGGSIKPIYSTAVNYSAGTIIRPNYSWNTARLTSGGLERLMPITWATSDTTTSPHIDLAGMTSAPGYSKLKGVVAATFKMEWTLPFGDSTYGVGSFGFDSAISGAATPYYNNFYLRVANAGSTNNLQIDLASMTGSGSAGTLPQAWTYYNNRWLTAICSTSDSWLDFANWAGPTDQDPNLAMWFRFQVYDTITQELLHTEDQASPAGDQQAASYVGIDKLYTSGNGSVPGGTSGPNSKITINCTAFDSLTPHRIGSLWCNHGSMFDPSATTDRSWLTVRPNDTIDGAQSWVNFYMKALPTKIGTGNEANYYWAANPNNTSRWVNPVDDKFFISGGYGYPSNQLTDAEFAAAYSLNDIPQG